MVPTPAISDLETLKAMNHIYGDFPRNSYRSHNARPLMNAAILAGLTSEKSAPGVSQTNAQAETTNKTAISGTRRLLCNSGLPACWWPYAGPCFCFLRNALLDEHNECSYYEQHGSHFPGLMIPFGCLVYFRPSPTVDRNDKAAPTMRPGVFMGYRTPPGGLWAGDYPW